MFVCADRSCWECYSAGTSGVSPSLPNGEARFCSGANDKKLCIWSYSGELVSTIERQEEENLYCLLPINNFNKIVTGSNSSLLLVYRTESRTFDRLLAYHRDSVRCLVNLFLLVLHHHHSMEPLLSGQSETMISLLSTITKNHRNTKNCAPHASCCLSDDNLIAAAVTSCVRVCVCVCLKIIICIVLLCVCVCVCVCVLNRWDGGFVCIM